MGWLHFRFAAWVDLFCRFLQQLVHHGLRRFWKVSFYVARLQFAILVRAMDHSVSFLDVFETWLECLVFKVNVRLRRIFSPSLIHKLLIWLQTANFCNKTTAKKLSNRAGTSMFQWKFSNDRFHNGEASGLIRLWQRVPLSAKYSKCSHYSNQSLRARATRYQVPEKSPCRCKNGT